jgi:hypothetical protein
MSQFPHEDGAWDLDENEVLDPADTLDGDLTDDPLDQGMERALGQQRRAGRLIAHEEEMYADSDTSLVLEDRGTALDVGIDGGAATAEEAAVHVLDNDDEDAD